MTEIEHLRDNVDKLSFDGKEVFLIGTAHISEESVRLVEQVINEVNPDTIAVELCDSRYQALKDPERWKRTDIVSVIRTGKAYVLLAQLMLLGFQKKIGKQLKVKPGAEMMRAMELAEQSNARTVLADREIRLTLKRSWAGLSLFGITQLITAMVGGLFSKEQVSEDEIERLKSADALDEAMREFSEVMPQIRTTLIDERDQYLAAKIRGGAGTKTVAVVGAGHVPGILKMFDNQIDVASLEQIPAPSLVSRMITYGVPLLICGIIIYAFNQSGVAGGMEVVGSWVLITGCFGAVGATLTLAHPMSIVLAFITAPLTPLNPIIKSGRVAALSEAILRKPQVSDFESIGDDISTVRGIFRNRISHVLAVLVVTTGMTWIGIVWGAKVIAELL